MEADDQEERGGGAVAGRDAWAAISRVNADLHCVDDIAFGDDRDDFVEQINLHGNSIESMDGLETFTRVVELCLSSNCIEEVSFHALESLVSLRVLDLSANSIESTLGFPQLPNLEELSLAHNRLQRLDGMTRPVKFPRLRYLDLRGNEIDEFNGLIALQRLKRLVQLRLQANDGSLANPLCDHDDYQDTMIKMLPHLKFIDEEEVDLLKEVGSIRMPKYRSIMRRITSSNSSSRADQRITNGSPAKSEPPPSLVAKRRDSPVDRQYVQATSTSPGVFSPARSPPGRSSQQTPHPNQHKVSDIAVQTPETLPRPPADLSVDVDTARTAARRNRLVLKESSTNTDVEPVEKELAKREQDISHREARVKETEEAFLTRERQLVDAQKLLEEQVAALKADMEETAARADAAQKSVAEITSRLDAEVKEHAEAQRKLDSVVSELKRSLTSKDDEWIAKVADLNEQHRRELAALDTAKGAAEKSLSAVEIRVAALTEQVQAQEAELKAKDATLAKNERMVSALTAEIERWRVDSSSLASQLSGESLNYKERMEDSQRRTKQLDKQVADLQSSLEAVYSKCIEKDENIHQLRRSLLAKQGEVDELKTQHAKAMNRQDKLQQQQQDLYDKQLQASILQIEMEFRKEYQLAARQYRELQRHYHDSVKETRRLKDSYSLSRKREAGARAEIYKIQAILADDKHKLYTEDVKRTDEFEHKLRAAEDRCLELDKQIEVLRRDNERIGILEAQLKDLEAHADGLRAEIERLNEQQSMWKKQEDDLRAAVKVKDVMLKDQLRQINEMRHDREELEARFNDEMAEFQAQVEELEAALDDSAQRAMDGESKCETLESEKQQLERQITALSEQVDEQASALEQKRTALDFIEQEMEKMRSALSNQDEMFQKRLQKRIEQHREEIERVRATGEEERERLRIEAETERREMLSKYQSLSTDLQSVVAQNAKLRIAVEQERKKNTQNDHDMRVLLAQIDRERHMKQEHLRQIKSLFEQLQRDVP